MNQNINNTEIVLNSDTKYSGKSDNVCCNISNFNLIYGDYSNSFERKFKDILDSDYSEYYDFTFMSGFNDLSKLPLYYQKAMLDIYYPTCVRNNDEEFLESIVKLQKQVNYPKNNSLNPIKRLCGILKFLSEVNYMKNKYLFLVYLDVCLPNDICSRLMFFLVKHFNDLDIKVFVKTNNDQMVNSLRVNVNNLNIKADEVSVIYLDINDNVFQPKIDKDGRFNEYSDGFLDEWNNNLMSLL